MKPAHAKTTNGPIQSEISPLVGEEKMTRRGVELLDGQEDYATSLWCLPDGKRLSDELPSGWPYAYIQSAGSAERMTIEIRVFHGDDGVGEQFAVGRPVDDQFTQPLVRVPWAGHVLAVFENEVFDAEEAGDIYWYYCRHDTVPDGYMLRQLDV